MVRNEISKSIFICFDNLCRYIFYLTTFYMAIFKLLITFITTSIKVFSKENVGLSFLLLMFLMLGRFLNAFRPERIESEFISFRKHWCFLEMLSLEIILKKKPLKISHNSVSEILLPFSVRLIFLPFQRPFCEMGYWIVQVTVVWFFCGSQQFFTKISLMFEVLLIIFSFVLQKIIF